MLIFIREKRLFIVENSVTLFFLESGKDKALTRTNEADVGLGQAEESAKIMHIESMYQCVCTCTNVHRQCLCVCYVCTIIQGLVGKQNPHELL